MKIIAHRGNLNGPNPAEENYPDYIQSAIRQGYDVEIDLWVEDNELWLGHDEPAYKIYKGWLNERHNRLWIHCKNLDALEHCSMYKDLNFFAHESDPYVVTSRGYIWAYPGYYGKTATVMVMPEYKEQLNLAITRLPNHYGICTDYAQRVKDAA